MPGFTTHYMLGVLSYKKLPSCRIKFMISKYVNLYQLGLQGPDIFFYNLPILRHRDDRNVGSYMHEHHINRFFMCYLQKLSLLKSEQQRSQGLAYLCGYLCHYIGDAVCHPYVYGRIGYDPKAPNHGAHGKHAALENDIDALLLRKYKHKKPSEFNQAATILLNPQELQFISRFLTDCINETYYPITYHNSFQISSRSVRMSIMAIKWGCRTLADPSGKKTSRIAFWEKLILNEPVVSKKMVTDNVEDVRKSLNLDHERWVNPWDPAISSTASFPELFQECIDRCVAHIQTIDQYLLRSHPFKQQDFHRLLTDLGSYSFHSGLSTDE